MADNDVINGFLGDIGFSIKSAVDKVKDTATKVSEGAKQLSPQYQAGKAAFDSFKGGMKTERSITPSGRTISRRVPVSSGTAIPTTTSSYRGGIGTKLNAISRKIFGKQSLFGIPMIIVAPLGIGFGWTMFKKLSRKR